MRTEQKTGLLYISNGLLLINPLLCLVFSFYSILKYKYINKFAFAFSLSLLFIYLPVMADVSANFYMIQAGNVDDLNLFNYIPFLGGKYFDLDYYYFVLFYTFGIVYFYSFFIEKCTKLKEYNYFLLVFFVILSQLDFVVIMNVSRNYLAIVFFCLILWKMDISHGLKFFPALLLFIPLIIIHKIAIVYILFFVFAFYIRSKYIYLVLLVLSVLSSIFIGEQFISIIKFASIFVDTSIEERIDLYINSDTWGVGVEHLGIGARFYQILKVLYIALISIVLFFINVADNNLISRICKLGIIFSVFMIDFYVFFHRFYLFTTVVFLIVIYRCNIQRKWMLLISVFAGSLFILGSYIQRGVFTEEYSNVFRSQDIKTKNIGKVFYTPTLFLLKVDSFGYSDSILLNEAYRGKYK